MAEFKTAVLNCGLKLFFKLRGVWKWQIEQFIIVQNSQHVPFTQIYLRYMYDLFISSENDFGLYQLSSTLCLIDYSLWSDSFKDIIYWSPIVSVIQSECLLWQSSSNNFAYGLKIFRSLFLSRFIQNIHLSTMWSGKAQMTLLTQGLSRTLMRRAMMWEILIGIFNYRYSFDTVFNRFKIIKNRFWTVWNCSF